MLQSQLFCKTKKTAPKDAEAISCKYLTRGDFIEQSFSGIYRLLPLGFRVFKKIEDIIRKEMLNLGAQEIVLPVLQNKKLWAETDRWQTIDPPLFKLKDRHKKETALGPTHEEEMTHIFRQRIKSYQDLPLYLFQIQNKFRNEMRPTGGLLRTREFFMKDLYSFHAQESDLAKFYEKIKAAYSRIFNKCGLSPICVEASPGTIGGELSHEFMVFSSIGEDRVVICKKCKTAANIEKTGEIKKCPKCKNELEKKSCIEIGHIFNLGTKYSKQMGALYSDKNGGSKPAIMGCYGIGLQRLMAVVVELNHDEKGIIWPKETAPFAVHLIEVENTAKIKKEAKSLYENLLKKGIEILRDDRVKSAGEKFVEADLIGIPVRIVISERTLRQNSAEIKQRNKKETKLIKIKNLSQFLKS